MIPLGPLQGYLVFMSTVRINSKSPWAVHSVQAVHSKISHQLRILRIIAFVICNGDIGGQETLHLIR